MEIKYYLIISLIYFVILYGVIGFGKIWTVILMYAKKSYWTDYNTIEFAAWISKAAIIVPGLIFGIEIWQFHFLTLFTSSLLIWASMRKNLPTLIVFNSIWIIISLTIITRNLIAF